MKSTNLSTSSSKQGSDKATVTATIINLAKAFVGMGLLTFSAGFKKSGWLGGIIFFFLCGSSIMYLNLQLISIADKQKSKAQNIAQFTGEILGQKGKTVVQIFLLCLQFSICIAIAIFFTTYFQESMCFFTNYNKKNHLCGSRIPSLLISFITVLPSIFIRKMQKLKDWCLVANALIGICIIIIFTACVLEFKLSFILSNEVQAFNWNTIGESIGIYIFAFKGITLYFELRSSMQEPLKFQTILRYTFIGIMILHSIIGLLGYSVFGSSTQDIILFNFSMSNPFFIVAQIFYQIAVLLSYPLQIFPIIGIIEQKMIEKLKINGYKELSQEDDEEHYFKQSETYEKETKLRNLSLKERKKKKQTQQNEEEKEGQSPKYLLDQYEDLHENSEDGLEELDSKSLKRFYIESIFLRFLVLSGVFISAIVFKKLGIFLNLVGSIGGAFFCIILPVLIFEKAIPDASDKIKYFHRGLFLFALLISTYATVSSISIILN